MDSNGTVGFKPSEVVSFDEALAFIEAECRPGNTCLVAVDQPTIVPNRTGCRPVDRVAASVISFIGGAV
jgi:predicted RNase H-like nuclease